ncbi:MAG: pentapeptide repeat-containing protein [Deltaproteobacteria bacterium]|nr:pentapeptide repeat-containing protein [Deltaproteobacteria bacterium]
MITRSAQNVLRDLEVAGSLERANLAGLELQGISIPKANLARADLRGANLAGADLRGADLSSANLREANLTEALLEGAKLRHADLEDANLSKAALRGADLAAANLEGANLERASLVNARLERAVLIDANVGKGDLGGARCRGADWNAAYLGGAILRGSDLARGNLQAANLEEADLTDADLRDANLSTAVLTGAVLDGARVFGAALSEVQLESSKTLWVDLSASGDRTEKAERAKLGGFPRLALLRAAGSGTDAAGAGEGGPSAQALAAAAPPAAPVVLEPGARFFGRGDVLRNAELVFAPGAVITVEGTFDRCQLHLGEGTRLEVGRSGSLVACKILGAGHVIVLGRLTNDGGDGAETTARVLRVAAGGFAAGRVRQPDGGTRFGFEPGCVLRLEIE